MPQELTEAQKLQQGSTKTRSAMWGKTRKGMSPVPNTVEHGLIVEEPDTMQKRKYAPGKADDGELMFYDDGNKQMQLVIKIQTDHRDDADDDGVRAIYASGQMLAMIRQATKDAGAQWLEMGGHLWVRFVEQEFGDFKKNIWAAKYEKPAPKAQVEMGWDSNPAVAHASVTTPTPAANADMARNSMLDRMKDQQQSGLGNLPGRVPVPRTSTENAGFDDEPPF